MSGGMIRMQVHTYAMAQFLNCASKMLESTLSAVKFMLEWLSVFLVGVAVIGSTVLNNANVGKSQ